MTTLIITLGSIFAYLPGALATGRLIYVKRHRNGQWQRAEKYGLDGDNAFAIALAMLFWPMALAYALVTLPLKEEKAVALQRKIDELERELKL